MRTEQIVLRTLGTARIDVGPVQIRPNAVRRFAAVLYLSAEAGRRVPRRVLIDLLFPDQNERNGLHSLRELVYQLKAAGVALESDQEGVELPAELVSSDHAEVLRAERLTIEQIRAAQGGFLPGYVPHESEAYKEWYEPFRAKVSFALSQVLLAEQSRAWNVGQLEQSAAAARACLVISPLNEHAIKALAQTMALGGDKRGALRLLDEYAAEVGAHSPTLRKSVEALRRRIGERTPESYRSSGDLPFLGRDSEMLKLRQYLVTSRAGQTQLVVVVGQLGIGKSRLVGEFATLAALENTRIECAAAQPFDRGRPMGLFVDVAPRLLAMPGSIGTSPASMEALRRLTLSGTSGISQEARDADPEAVSGAITRALDDLVAAVTIENHLTLVVEDAHWADPLSLKVLSELASRSNRRMLVVLTTRDRELQSLGDRIVDSAALIRLGPLDHSVTRELAQRALQGTAGANHAALHNWMADVANGSPLFVATLVAHYAATGAAFVVPPSLHELIGRQLDTLDAATSVVLQTCVLLGSLATIARTTAALDLPYIDAVSAVARLDNLRLLKCVDNKLLPSHAIVADAVLRRSAEVVLRMLHLRIAEVLETEIASEQSPTFLWNCADHLILAGEHPHAVSVLRRCADHAVEIGRPASAADILASAAKLRLPDSTRIELLRAAVRLARRAREHDLVLEAIAAIRDLDGTVVHDDIEIAELTSLSVTFVDAPDFEQRVLACVRSESADCEHRVRAAVAALMFADTYSRPRLAVSVVEAVRAQDLQQVDEQLRLEYNILYHVCSGQPTEAAPYAFRLQSFAPTLPPALAAVIQLNVANAYWRAGLLEMALEANERAYVLAAEGGAVRAQLMAALHATEFLSDMDQHEQAHEWHERVQHIRAAHTREIGEFETVAEEIVIALGASDVARARNALSLADRKHLFSTPFRQRWRRCFEARFRQLSGGAPLSEDEVRAVLADWSDVTSTSGIKDSEAVVLFAAFRQDGRLGDAGRMLVDFLAWRVQYSLAPIPWQLREEIARAGLLEVLERWDEVRRSKISPFAGLRRTNGDCTRLTETLRTPESRGLWTLVDSPQS